MQPNKMHINPTLDYLKQCSPIIWVDRMLTFKGLRRERYRYSEFFWSVFTRIWTEYGRYCVKSVQIRSFLWSVFSRIRTEYEKIQSISLYSVRMLENTDQKNSEYGHFSRIGWLLDNMVITFDYSSRLNDQSKSF